MKLHDSLSSARRTIIVSALEIARGNVAQAARDLDVPVRSLWRLIRQHGIAVNEYRMRGEK